MTHHTISTPKEVGTSLLEMARCVASHGTCSDKLIHLQDDDSDESTEGSEFTASEVDSASDESDSESDCEFRIQLVFMAQLIR